MPRAKRDVFAAASGSDLTVKPVAPADLWAQLSELSVRPYERPANSFTLGEYIDKMSLDASTANRRLAALVKKGAVTKLRRGLYQLVTQ